MYYWRKALHECCNGSFYIAAYNDYMYANQHNLLKIPETDSLAYVFFRTNLATGYMV